MINDNHVLYKILGHHAIGINKTLSTYAIDDYMSMLDEFITRLSTTYVDIIFQPCAFREEYTMTTVLKVSAKYTLSVSYHNYGEHMSGARLEIEYMQPDKYITHMSCKTKKTFTFAVFTRDIHGSIVRTMKDALRDALRDIFKCSMLDKTIHMEMMAIISDICLDATEVEHIMRSRSFHITESTIKETPSSSSYHFKFVSTL